MALAATSCADILGFERPTLRDDDNEADTGRAGAGGASGNAGGSGAADASFDVNRSDGGRGATDASVDGGSDRGGAPGSGGASGSTGTTTGSGGSSTGGAGGGTGGSGGGSGGTSDASIDTTGRDGGGGGTLDVAMDRGITCAADQKVCNGACVAKSDPATGCAQVDCAPCALDHATATCSAVGQCAVDACSTGFANCNNDAKDGCEADLSKVETCGSCTTKCDAAAPLCSGSNGTYQCVTGCTAPTSTLCGTQCVDVNTNASHCSACMMACPTKANGDPVCASRMCDFTCHNGYHKCTATQTCASNTDINACGDTCKKCDVPTNGRVNCTAGDCAVTCNTNYHPCTVNNVTTCADDNSAATCGTTSCTPCPAPIDPNADPAPTCVNKTCGFKCKAGFNLCGGVCSDTSSILTCGPSCTACTKPANASTVTCNGTTCGFTCNPGYEPSGAQCVPATNLYVSTSGSDSNPGTQGAPFRTWKQAAQVAQAGAIVNFAAGTYDNLGGDDFADAIPASVTLQRSGSGTVTFAGDGQHALTFAGSGTVQNITLTNFGSPFVATTGTQTVKAVAVTQPLDAIRLSGTAVMVISDGSSISGGPAVNRYLFNVEGSAQLTVRDSTVTGAWDACVTPTLAGDGIVMSASAIVSLVGVTFGGTMNATVMATGSSKLSLTNSTLRNSCGGGFGTRDNASAVSSNTNFGGIGVNDSSTVTITGGAIDDGGLGLNIYGQARGSFRSVSLGGVFGVTVMSTGQCDFGTSTSPGNNTFNPSARDGGGLNVNVDGASVLAVGNKWVPNEQGANANGNMPAGVVWGPASGKNFSISSNVSTVEF